MPGTAGQKSHRNAEDGRQARPAGVWNELGGTVYGASIQVGNVHGGVYIHQPIPRLPPPNQLPPSARLIGRAVDLEAMDTARDSGVIVVTGQPGIGKTALALSWARTVRSGFPDGALFADLHGYAPDGPARPGHVLAGFLRAFGTDPRQMPPDLAELTAAYRSLTIDRRMLVMLDDALSAAQVIPLLPSSPEAVAVVTSRTRLGGLAARGARVVRLDRLDTDSALELLARTIGDSRVQAQSHAARELVELCARNPLAVCVAGGRLAARSRWPIDEMVQAMAQERERLAALAMEDDLAVRGVLDVSYNVLPGPAARMYRLMSLYPGTGFDSWIAAAAAAVPRAEAKRLLATLTDANLLDDAENSSYTFHDLPRLHAREKVEEEESPPARDEATRRMLDWFLDTASRACLVVMPYHTDVVADVVYPPAEPLPFPSPGAALEWLDRELPNAMAAARLASSQRLWRTTWELANAMWPVFHHRGRAAERLELDQLGLDAARAAGDSAATAKMLYKSAGSAISVGRLDEAEDYITKALNAWRRLGKPDRVAGSQRRLGLIAMARNHPDEAIGWFNRALAAYRELADARHIALTLTDLADVFIETGRPQEAIPALEEAGSLLIDSPDPHNQARVLTRLGRANERTGRLGAAVDYLEQALRVMRGIGSARGEAEALLSLGDLAIRTGRRDDARGRYADAHQVLVSLGSPEEARVREILDSLDQPDQH